MVVHSSMNPKLVAIAGPSKGGTFMLTEEELLIGRDPTNQLSMEDSSVSWQHCLIKREAGQFSIKDLESRNGTFVNGVPLQERSLEDGDQIKIGDCVFLFLLHDGEPPASSTPVELDNEILVTGAMVQLQGADALYLKPEKLATLPPTARMARDLNALLKISTAINALRGLEALQQQLLELVFEVVPARRGAILLVGEALEQFDSVFARDRHLGSDRPVRVSRTAVDRVLRERISILSNDVRKSEAFSAAESLIAFQVTSLLAVPLMLFGKVLGVIYLDTSDPMVRFNEDHLQLMTAIAGIAAAALDNARRVERLENENRRLQEEINIEHNMVGESIRMRQVCQFIAKVAPTASTVLIRGESGTGKELAARAIHLNSPRKSKPFVAINCAALTESLLESELFGHEKGAFTGAVTQKRGKLEVADGGTVFLDEVGELAPTLQAKILRVLQEREFERVGGIRPIKVDIRLIAATNKDLEKAIQDGSFRRDLYYRLNVVSVTMPALRERREDISLLATYFATKYGNQAKRRVMGISRETRACLVN
ncbi:MAG: sigma-54-dependent Fis family transcriptional regulator [Acidobacteria bacterium]|nr:MAG: sigma-54-dependent Fis family transcriptional regulator [Acidobacteriota bacterium]